MKIDKNLNLVVPVESEHGDIFFHHTPILRETFQRYHFVLAATFTRLLEAGMQMTGAAIAAMTLEEVSREMMRWEPEEKNKQADAGVFVKSGFMDEIERLTTVLILGEKGWEPVPVNVAINRDLIDDMDWQEAKQRIVFFTLICGMTRKAVKEDLLTILNESWQTQTTSSTCSEFAASLPTSTETGTSSAAGKVSSVPY